MKPITDTHTMDTIVSTSPCEEVPQCFIKVQAFLNAGKENREWVAYQAYSGRIPWAYSIPLSSVVAYLKWRGPNP